MWFLFSFLAINKVNKNFGKHILAFHVYRNSWKWGGGNPIGLAIYYSMDIYLFTLKFEYPQKAAMIHKVLPMYSNYSWQVTPTCLCGRQQSC